LRQNGSSFGICSGSADLGVSLAGRREAEIVYLRQRLIVLKRTETVRPRLKATDRLIFVCRYPAAPASPNNTSDVGCQGRAAGAPRLPEPEQAKANPHQSGEPALVRLARATEDGVIRRSQTQDNPSDRAAFDTACPFGAWVAETILAAVTCDRINRPNIRPHSSRHSESKKLLQEGGRPHTGSDKRISRHAEARRSSSPKPAICLTGARD